MRRERLRACVVGETWVREGRGCADVGNHVLEVFSAFVVPVIRCTVRALVFCAIWYCTPYAPISEKVISPGDFEHCD